MKPEIYSIDFGNRLTCTIAPRQIDAGQLAVAPIEWSRKPTKEEYFALIPAYRNWMLSVYEQLATKWNRRMTYYLNAEESRTEVWLFVPNQPAELVEVKAMNIA